MKNLKLLLILSVITFGLNASGVLANQEIGRYFSVMVPKLNGHKETTKLKKSIDLSPQEITDISTSAPLDFQLKYTTGSGSTASVGSWRILETGKTFTYSQVEALQEGWQYWLYIDSRITYLSDNYAYGKHWVN